MRLFFFINVNFNLKLIQHSMRIIVESHILFSDNSGLFQKIELLSSRAKVTEGFKSVRVLQVVSM